MAFPVYNRPRYLTRVLDAWSRVRGVADALLVFCCEPGCDEAVELCRRAEFAERAVLLNPERLGHGANTMRSMALAYTLTDYAIAATDDFLPSSDLLELHGWHRALYADDTTVLGLRSGTDRAHDGGLGAIWRTQLVGALTGFHRHKWAELAASWPGCDNWWMWADAVWGITAGLDVLAPAISRAEDIGEVGANPLPEPWAVMQARSSFVADVPRTDYHEVRHARERGFERRVEAR